MAEPTLNDIGGILREARERQGLPLRDIATSTKISMHCLEAIERNDFARLPGGVFRRAYVRAYAVEVGLDADALVRTYVEGFETADPPPPPPARMSDIRWPIVAGAAAGIVAVCALAAALIFGNGGGTIGHTAEDPSTAVTEIGFEDAAPSEPESSRAPVRLALKFRGDCWVSASADGETVLRRLMKAGEEARVDALERIEMYLGDAGAVSYELNGQRGRPFGTSGEVAEILVDQDGWTHARVSPASPASR